MMLSETEIVRWKTIAPSLLTLDYHDKAVVYEQGDRFESLFWLLRGKCQAYCRSELSLVSQLAEVSEILPARPDDNSFCAFGVTENSSDRLNAAPEKEVRRRQ